ncbi:MAG: toll/interleukin-1 receptor domain-containing protein [Clostridia bacterium]|nr:toll/interleukin-1 receptor domain-containing protein [Clostridia bacterium]
MGLFDFLKSKKTKAAKDLEIRKGVPYIYISYALADAGEVSGIVSGLRDRGYRVWFDEETLPNDSNARRTEKALEGASLFAVFLSEKSRSLLRLRSDIDRALNSDKPFLAIYLEKTDLTGDLMLRLAAKKAICKYETSEEEFYENCAHAFESLGLLKTPSTFDPAASYHDEPAPADQDAGTVSSGREEDLDAMEESKENSVLSNKKADRDHMRRLLMKAPPLIDSIAADQVPFGSQKSADLIDILAEFVGNKNEKRKDDDELQKLKDDRYTIINYLGAIKKQPGFLPLYRELGRALREYGLFDEEVSLLEDAISKGVFSGADLDEIKNRYEDAKRLRDEYCASMSEKELISEKLQTELWRDPPDVKRIFGLMEKCGDDGILYDVCCYSGKDPDMITVRDKAARSIKNRDYRYALSSSLMPARTSMILDLFDPLEDDELFTERIIIADPDGRNKAHALLFCKKEGLLMLGRKFVFGERRFCEDRLRRIGSKYPEAYEEADPEERSKLEKLWLADAAESAVEILREDEAVRERLPGSVRVESDLLRLFIAFHHPRKSVRWWHAKKIENPELISYAGSWTQDGQIKESLSVKIDSTELITEMIFGDLSAIEPVFGFKKPDDLTVQDRFCVEIMKNNPDAMIREHVRKELIRAKVSIPGVDLETPDPLYNLR